MATDDRRQLEAEPIEDRVLAYLRRELLDPEAAVTRETDLLSGGVLDSIAVLRLATFVGQEFQIDIRPGDFVIENFRSVEVIAAYVCRARSRAEEADGGDGR